MTVPGPTAPQDCMDMPAIRQGIDDLDRKIVALLAQRMRYIEAAARVKGDRGTVRDEARKADVIEKACAAAKEHELDPALIADLYELLVERSIAHEFVKFDALAAR